MHHSKTDYQILKLSLIDGIGPVTIKKIFQIIAQNNIENIQKLLVKDWLQFGITPSTASLLYKELQSDERLNCEYELMQKEHIDWITIESSFYPELLKQIYAPPPVLYWRGKPPGTFSKCLSIVGSRKADVYAQKIITDFVPSLVQHDWCIVSGGAIGADSMAHQATLNENGSTVVVLGSGLLRPYPQTNKRLFEKVCESGTLLSSFPVTTVAHPGNFPSRNRIIAGLSNGCLVVQAAQKSGARITAQYALDEGRHVFAIPGLLNNPLSEGCHSLIRDGATLVRNVNDIFSEFGEEEELIKKEKSKPKILTTKALLIQLCTQPKSADELSRTTKLSLEEVQAELFALQLDGKIEQNFTGKWEAN